MVIAYQGDGDLAAIGTAEIIHAANRGEKITVFFVNNAIYGMAGGQIAPTTLVGQRSTTSPWGRRPSNEGYPLHMAELLATLEAPVYMERVALKDNKNIMKARKAVRKALELQRDGAGFSFVEILSPCPTIWKMTPQRRAQMDGRENAGSVSTWRVARPQAGTDSECCATGDSEETSASEADRRLLTTGRRERGVSGFGGERAGFGGQGVLLLGQILAEMGMRDGREVSWLPSYGPEMRSGSAHCYVCLSNERVGSPLTEHPDVLIAMNELSLHKFAKQVGPHGTFSTTARNCQRFPPRRPCVLRARIGDCGQARHHEVTNMVMMGALLELTHTMAKETAFAVLKMKVKNAKLLEVDYRAIDAGIDCIRKQIAERLAVHAREDELTHAS